MASSSSSSSSSPPKWTYRVFTSFHGPDVRKTFLSHLRKQFNMNGISMFNDEKIERGETISPALTQAIRESRISIVVLSKNYASSSWCLDELVDIFKCKESMGQKVIMTVFYGVNPSDVREQTGEFGRIFKNTCARKSEEEIRKWSQALNHVGNIAGEHFANWENESEMIEKIAKDVSNKINATVSKDFEDMVGIEAHLKKMQSLLHLEYEEEAMIVGICGPAGIGKTIIARALHSRLSDNFQLTCFMEHIRGSYNSGIDEYGLKMRLQEQLLSNILNLNGIRILHLGAIPERLCDQKVLIILDDVDDLQQLEALADKTSWFGPGSRIIVTTEDQELLKQHGINITYHVDFPTKKDACKIICRYAFRKSLIPYGFEKLVERVAEICSNLPLGLRVLGSSLRGKKEDEWEYILHILENNIDRKIESVLRVGYDHLHNNDQVLFLLIASFFNHQDGGHVEAMLSGNNFNVRFGLKNLTSKSLIQISTEGEIVMHKLLQQVGREMVRRQDPGKRQILIDADEICDVLNNDSGSRSVMGISFDISTLSEDVYISPGALRKFYNLQFLSIYKSRLDTNARVHVLEDIDFPPRLKLLHWEEYPVKCLPNTFRPENLVELNMKHNQLEKLWEGIQPLRNMKKMNLADSVYLKEVPDLSKCTNLEILELTLCESLVEIPSSVGNLEKLKTLDMTYCMKLQVVPNLLSLASLETVEMGGCWQLRKLPEISRNITSVMIADTMLEDLLGVGSVRNLSRLQRLTIYGSVNRFPESEELYLKRGRGGDIDKIPDCIKDHLHALKDLVIVGCPKLASLPVLPRSLEILHVENCESLETLIIPHFPFDFDSPLFIDLSFFNCFKLGEVARRLITQRSFVKAWLPGKNIPAEFHHRAIGNSLTIPSETDQFRLCVVISPKEHQMFEDVDLFCRNYLDGIVIQEQKLDTISSFIGSEHLFISYLHVHGYLDGEILLETSSQDIDIIEWGLQILTYQTERSTSSQGSYESCSEQVSQDNDDVDDLSDESFESCSEQVSDKYAHVRCVKSKSEKKQRRDRKRRRIETYIRSEQVSEDDDNEDLSEGNFESCSE